MYTYHMYIYINMDCIYTTILYHMICSGLQSMCEMHCRWFLGLTIEMLGISPVVGGKVNISCTYPSQQLEDSNHRGKVESHGIIGHASRNLVAGKACLRYHSHAVTNPKKTSGPTNSKLSVEV